jgi:hypothetical protein
MKFKSFKIEKYICHLMIKLNFCKKIFELKSRKGKDPEHC